MKKPMTLGKLVFEMDKHRGTFEQKGESSVYVSTPLGWLHPVSICSYRGYYEQLALIASNHSDFEPCLAINLFKAFEDAAFGKVKFTGYKGGEYLMCSANLVWVVLSYADTSNLLVSGFEELESGGFIFRTCIDPNEDEWR